MRLRIGPRRAVLTLAALALLSCAALGQKTSGRGASSTAEPRPTALDAAQLLRDVQALASDEMQGRKTGTAGGVKAREYIIGRFKEVGLKPFGASFVREFTFTTPRDSVEHRGANIVGFVEGRERPERFLVVTAHYDHLGVVEGALYHGADDNASGVAALLALAAYFVRHPPAHTVIFAALDAEEWGLRGARAFVAAPPVEARRIALDVNLDMISRNERGELYAVGVRPYPSLKPYLDAVAARAGVRLLQGHDDPARGARDDWTNQSDQGAFHAAGIPFVYFGVEDHPDYHKPTDTFANIQPDFFVRAAEMILDAVKTLDAHLDDIGKERARAK